MLTLENSLENDVIERWTYHMANFCRSVRDMGFYGTRMKELIARYPTLGLSITSEYREAVTRAQSVLEAIDER